MQTVLFWFTRRNPLWNGGQPGIRSPSWFTAPPTPPLLQSTRTGIALGFITTTAASAERGAEPTKDSGDLCTDLGIKCTEIPALRAGKEIPKEHSWGKKKKLFFAFFFYTQKMCLLIFAAWHVTPCFPCVRGKAKARNESRGCRSKELSVGGHLCLCRIPLKSSGPRLCPRSSLCHS